MKTIEERAYDCAYDISNDWMKDSPTWDDVELAYKRGATEQRDIDVEEGVFAQQENILNAISKQKQIDIVKACKWLAEHADDYYYSSSQADCCGYDDEHLVADFRKAM